MVWAPSEDTRTAIAFWLGCLQIVTVIAGVSTAAATFFYHSQAEQQRAIDQDQRAKDQLAALQRELQRPYQEKKLNLYLNAARVLAHLAASPSVDREKTEARFWELYWGELAFVESRTDDEAPTRPSVEHLMVQFCELYFGKDRCHGKAAEEPGGMTTAVRTDIERAAVTKAAIDMARQASDEIRRQWESIPR